MEESSLPLVDSPAVGKILSQFEVTPELLEKASNFVLDSVTRFESQRDSNYEEGTNRKAWSDRLKQMDRAYRGILESDRAYQGFDDKGSGLMHDNVEMIISRIKESIIPADYDNLVKVDAPSNLELAKMRTDQLSWQLDKVNIEEKIDRFVRTCVKFGTGFIKVPLIDEQHTVLTQELVTITEQIPIIDDANQPIIDANGQQMFHVEQRQEIQTKPKIDKKYFGPGFEVIDDIERIYLDSFIEDIQKQSIVVHEIIVSHEHLMEGVRRGIYFEDQVQQIKDLPEEITMRGYNNSSRAEEIRGSVNYRYKDKNDLQPKEFKMFQAYADLAIPVGKDEKGAEITQVYKVVIGVIGNKCVQLMPNPYFHQMIPIIRGTYRNVEGEAYGISAIEPALGMFQMYQDLNNQLSDGNVISLNPITIIRAGALASQQDFNVEPGAKWYEKESGDIRPYVIQFDAAGGQQLLELLEQRINRTMGITPLMMGAGDATDLDKTWRGTNKLIQQSDKKFKSIAKNIEDACIRQWAEMAYKLNCQYTPIPNATGDEFATINGEISFIVKGVESYFERQEQIQEYLMFTREAINMPGINIPGLVNTIAELMKIKIDEQKYGPLWSPPPPPAPPVNPISTSINMPIDMSKGPTMLFAGAQVMKQRGIDLNIDSLVEANSVFINEFPEDAKMQSGVMPPGYDSYRKGDTRTNAKPNNK